MGRIEYFFKVTLAIWWRDVKEIFWFIVGLLVALFIYVPVGYILTKLEKRKSK